GPPPAEDRGKQIGEPGEGEGGFGLGPSVEEDKRAAPPCLFQASLPEDRLADPRLAGEDKCVGTLADSIQERLDRAELLIPPDDLHGSFATFCTTRSRSTSCRRAIEGA